MPNDIQQLEKRIADLEGILGKLFLSDRMILAMTLQMQDGRNIQLATSTGTKIGTASDQKLGLWGQVPVDQPETVSDATGTLANAVTTINAVISRLKEVGSIK